MEGRPLAILKWLLMAALAIVGVLSLFSGLGTPIPYIDSKELRSVGVPLGIVCIAVSVAIAFLWNDPAERRDETTKVRPPR